jgi:predicted nucleotidyltransferase
MNYNQLLNKTQGTLLYLSHSGSRLYGTSLPTSDTDYKGIFLQRFTKESQHDLSVG